MTPPTDPTDARDTTRRLEALREHDLPTKGGRTLAYVYDSGLGEVDARAREALAAFADSNGLDPTAFPSLLRMENDVVGAAADLVDAPAEAAGSVTSGGTESVLLAVQAARDGRPEVMAPTMVLPETAHPAFHKAAHYFGVEMRFAPVGADFRVDVDAVASLVDETTVLVVCSAPSYAHGVVDDVPGVAAVAAEAGTRCHVDACIGGWVLPFARRVGRSTPPWTFEVPGVTSISLDLHKYAYTPKGASVLLHRSRALRRSQLFSSARWPGYTMLNSTMQSTRSGAPLAAAWTVLQEIGLDGYDALVRRVLEGMDRLVAGVAGVPALHVVAEPDSTLVALATDGSCDVFTIADEMAVAGWFVQPQMSFAGRAPTLHLTLSAATADHVDALLDDLAGAVARAQQAGPVVVDPGVAEVVAALDPDALSEEDFDGLLAAAGLAGGEGGALALPERMAEVNALLDLASPRLREAVLTAFLERLARPERGAWGRPGGA